MSAASAARTTLRRAAQDAAARGFWVFPLGPGSKKPALRRRNWKDLATRNPEVIARAWRRAAFNIGIACGPSRLLVLDLDPSHGEPPPPEWEGARHGRDVLARLTAAHRVPYPIHTYRVATPSGGEHIYFTAPEAPELGNSSGRLGWRIDTRGAGGYVVAAGSVLRGGAPYRLLDDRSPAPLPDWLITALTPPPPPPPTTVHLAEVRVDAYVHAALVAQFERIVAAPRGQRHDTLLSAAGSIGRLVGAGMLTRDDAHQVLRGAADSHIGIDGFTEREAERVISDGLDFGIARPRRIDLH
ncbi:bifunctional DNA primase/polymerase [Nocardia amamiensis]|uniref:Bifunctional DNA primase/polymerase n=1 Tax=Nocardia amamiensis TaxID=404578 RepID=A0ABS0CZG7_9NOCA|nr:bifunctional DNA primase/polymerase [Nocardia amamiensis]MBF6301984.1 bifunctional DNA primase/polymerase [Nocardia amamiensis]